MRKSSTFITDESRVLILPLPRGALGSARPKAIYDVNHNRPRCIGRERAAHRALDVFLESE
jgi:hypothetical protein